MCKIVIVSSLTLASVSDETTQELKVVATPLAPSVKNDFRHAGRNVPLVSVTAPTG